MQDEILDLAKILSNAGQTEVQYLSLLCTAAEQSWEERLRSGITKEDCRQAFLCAAALSATAGLLAGKSGDPVSFTAGALTIREADGGTAAKTMLEQAEQLMAPYVKERDFCFMGVQG